MQDIIENVLIQTSPTTNPKLEILKTHFPECFDKEGKLLVDKLEKSLMGGGGGENSLKRVILLIGLESLMQVC